MENIFYQKQNEIAMVENHIKLEHHTSVIFDHRSLLPVCKRIKLMFASIQIKHDLSWF